MIDGKVEPDIFTTRLQKELNSSPQPCLVPFLKKSLPYLQQSLATHELSIEGVRPPTLAQIGKPSQPAINSQEKNQEVGKKHNIGFNIHQPVTSTDDHNKPEPKFKERSKIESNSKVTEI